MNNYNLTTIVSDFDGTILKHGAMEMDSAFLDILEQVLDKGYHFIAASGRQYGNLRFLMGRLADRVSYVAENGAIAVSQGEMIHKSALDKASLLEVIADLEKETDLFIVPCSPVTNYVLEKDVWMQNFLLYELKSNITVVKDFSFFPEDIIKLSVFWKNQVDREKMKFYHDKYDSSLQVMESGGNWVDFSNMQANKAVALRKLAEKEGFTLEQTVSFGDNENDMLMLQSTGVSYVMDTAKDYVKVTAQKECSDVGEMLTELFL